MCRRCALIVMRGGCGSRSEVVCVRVFPVVFLVVSGCWRAWGMRAWGMRVRGMRVRGMRVRAQPKAFFRRPRIVAMSPHSVTGGSSRMAIRFRMPVWRR